MSTKIVNRVNITIDDDLRFVLDSMKQSYPTLSYSDLIRMATGGYFAINKTQFVAATPKPKKKLTKAEIKKWADSLPELELTPQQEDELEKSIQSINTGVVLKSDQDIISFVNKLGK